MGRRKKYPVPPTELECRNCKSIKPVSEFYPANTPSGFMYLCKECSKAETVKLLRCRAIREQGVEAYRQKILEDLAGLKERRNLLKIFIKNNLTNIEK